MKRCEEAKVCVIIFLTKSLTFFITTKGSTNTILQSVVNNTFLYNMSNKQLWTKHHNKKKHHLLLCHQKIILHEYPTIWQLINVGDMYFDFVECFSKTQKYIMLHIMPIVIVNNLWKHLVLLSLFQHLDIGFVISNLHYCDYCLFFFFLIICSATITIMPKTMILIQNKLWMTNGADSNDIVNASWNMILNKNGAKLRKISIWHVFSKHGCLFWAEFRL